MGKQKPFVWHHSCTRDGEGAELDGRVIPCSPPCFAAGGSWATQTPDLEEIPYEVQQRIGIAGSDHATLAEAHAAAYLMAEKIERWRQASGYLP